MKLSIFQYAPRVRLFMINVFACGVVLFAAAHASAVTITMGGASGSVSSGDDIVLTLSLDNSGEPGLTGLAFSIQFDSALVQFTSAIQEHHILTEAQNENGLPTVGDNGLTRTGVGPVIVNSNELLFTWQNPATTWHENSNLLIATATFKAIADGDATFTVGAFIGATLGVNNGTFESPGAITEEIDTLNFVGSGDVGIGAMGPAIPEPSAALLFAAGIVVFTATTRGRRPYRT